MINYIKHFLSTISYTY